MASSSFNIEVTLPNGRRFVDARAGLDAFSKQMGNIVSAEELNKSVAHQLKNYLDTVAEAMRQRHRTPWVPGKRMPEGETTGQLFKRSGRLIDAIEKSVTVTQAANIVQGSIGGGVIPHGAIHEFGGTIKAKGKGFLTIPLPAALDSKGLPIKRKARDWPNTFVVESKKGNLVILQRRGNRLVPLYLLKKEVEIPPRLGLSATVEKTLDAFVDKLFDTLVKDINRRARGK